MFCYVSRRLWCSSGLSFIFCLFRRPCSLMLYNKCHFYYTICRRYTVNCSLRLCIGKKLLRRCEEELYLVDMSINFKKCSCIRFGPRCNTACKNIVSSTGVAILWSKELKYLGVTLVNSCTFKCNLGLSKKSFYLGFDLPTVRLAKHTVSFEQKFLNFCLDYNGLWIMDYG